VARSFLILHGYAGSGPGHWQTWLADRLARAGERVAYPELPEPDAPELPAWRSALEAELRALPDEPIVVCHSLSCILWLHHTAAAVREGGRAERVLLVAPPSRTGVPDALASFFPVPVVEPMGNARLVCSDNDPYCPEGGGALRRAGGRVGGPGPHQPRRGLRGVAGGRGVGARGSRPAHGARARMSSRIAPG